MSQLRRQVTDGRKERGRRAAAPAKGTFYCANTLFHRPPHPPSLPTHPMPTHSLTHSLTHPLTHSARLLAFSVWCEHTGESRELLLLSDAAPLTAILSRATHSFLLCHWVSRLHPSLSSIHPSIPASLNSLIPTSPKTTTHTHFPLMLLFSYKTFLHKLHCLSL